MSESALEISPVPPSRLWGYTPGKREPAAPGEGKRGPRGRLRRLHKAACKAAKIYVPFKRWLREYQK